MDAKKHITPILLIIVALVALMSTYAWFSSSTNIVANLEIYSGSPASFSLYSEGETSDGRYVFEKKYHGEKGYDETGTIYPKGNVDAPFFLFQNLEYKMIGEGDTKITFEMERAVVEVGMIYLDSFENTLVKVFGMSTSLANQVANSELAARYKTNDIDSPPSVNDASDKWCVVNNNGKVTHIVFEKNVINEYFHFNYWKSTETGILPNEENLESNPSNLANGITLLYGEDVSKAGIMNYAGVYIGFYGYDSSISKHTTCVFSDDSFRGSNFKFTFTVGGV